MSRFRAMEMFYIANVVSNLSQYSQHLALLINETHFIYQVPNINKIESWLARKRVTLLLINSVLNFELVIWNELLG